MNYNSVTKIFYRLLWPSLGCLLIACDPVDRSAEQLVRSQKKPAQIDSCDNAEPLRQALFGDLHVHTSYSFDAAANSTGATPEDAQRYARGGEIPFFPLDENGVAIGRAKIDRPLDFLAVTDHGEFLGERAICRTESSPMYDNAFCRAYRSNERQGMIMLGQVVTTETPERLPAVCGEDGSLCQQYALSPWQDIQAAANKANSPCEFTSFVAYEYTGTPGTSNYHRNVIFRNATVPDLPVSYIEAPIDSQLWGQLDSVCKIDQGCDYLTIPHNSNLANGRMAPYRKIEQTLEAQRAYAKRRLVREPIMEIFQHKGSSECINGLSTVFGAPDELCAVEAVRKIGVEKVFPVMVIKDGMPSLVETSEVTEECAAGTAGSNGLLGAGCVDTTDFQRSALLVGLKEQQRIGFNPIKLGIVAATDTHSANAGGVLESSWGGAVTGESTPGERLNPGLLTSGIDGNPGGLAGVWAVENTRDGVFDAMLRREVFGTSGPRIRPRLFAGWGLDEALCDDRNMLAKAYAEGIPMGGDLAAPDGESGQKPKLLAYAVKDPTGRQLQSLQLIKGWVDADDGLHNKVIPMAEVPAGADSLCHVYSDVDFDTRQPAYYYLRAVELESPRWHTFDCAALAADQRPPVCNDGSYPATIREMAWTSPIWYRGD
jgi:hypothetical protein